jgi:lysyl-tRNA synthetase class 2
MASRVASGLTTRGGAGNATAMSAIYASLIPVESSAIRAVGYDGSTLTVEFHNGRTYDHPHVPCEIYVGLMQAESKGEFYNKRIRGKYR